MFQKILIANRGEIACRLIKTARQLGIACVAIYSDADKNALHVKMADEAIYIGASPSRESYLCIDKIIAAAKKTGVQAIHPAYGFLSENADFCLACEKNNLVFIGPSAEAIRSMGCKAAAKAIMTEAGVPLIPGYHQEDQQEKTLKTAADKIGYPVLIKASAGGGGKGMRQVLSPQMFSAELAAAKREALNAFADDRMLIEKYLLQPRHVEIQIFCDQQGNAVYLAERDCSVQRRHQKIIEEAPAPGLSEKLRQAMGLAALRAARAINYLGAGTVEFLLDSSGEFYFMEMNTRLQVEHPVTEMITGLDLVEWQLRIACGEPLPLTQEQIQIKGHAFEARIYAEDPDRQFLPVSGKLSFLQPPSESKYVRVDTGVLQGDDVSVFYDPMIAKLIVWDENRDKALSRFSKALREYRIGGLSTNLEFLYNISTCEPFKNAELCTDFITKNQALIFQAKQQDKPRTIALAALYLRLRQNQQSLQKHLQINDPYSPWNLANAWRLNEAHIQHYSLYHQGEDYAVSIGQAERGNRDYYEIHSQGQSFCAQAKLDNLQMIADIDGHRLQISVANYDDNFTLYTQDAALHFNLPKVDQGEKDSGDQGGLTAPMNGTIVEIHAPPSSQVKKGDALLVMEAMKMEHTIRAPSDGTVMEYYFQAGQLVDGGAELLRFESTSSENIENNPVQ